MKYVFCFREKTMDRDACAYLETREIRTGSINIHGANYCTSRYPEYTEIETVLTEQDYNILASGECTEEDYKRILGILQSDNAVAFAEEIKKSEIDIMMEDFDLTEENIEDIYYNYPLDYFDHGIICYVYGDAEELGEYEIDSFGIFNGYNGLEKFFNYEDFGEHIASEEERYYTLNDGRIVEFAI